MPLWVRLLNLPLHLWLDLVLEAMGDAIGDFQMVDSKSSDILHTTYARILMVVDVSKGLRKKIKLEVPNSSWIQILDYKGIPFRCRVYSRT